MFKGHQFATTDHCGYIEILNDMILPEYLQLALTEKKYELGFDRSLRASLENVSLVEIEIPTKSNGEFDLDTQRQIVNEYRRFTDVQNKMEEITSEIKNKQIKI